MATEPECDAVWHSLPAPDVAERLGSDPHNGLTETEAAQELPVSLSDMAHAHPKRAHRWRGRTRSGCLTAQPLPRQS
jgi:hypothetical protein